MGGRVQGRICIDAKFGVQQGPAGYSKAVQLGGLSRLACAYERLHGLGSFLGGLAKPLSMAAMDRLGGALLGAISRDCQFCGT